MSQNRRQEKPQYAPFQRKIKKLGGHCLKTHGSNLRKGDPDFIGTMFGITFVVEFKKDSKTKAEPLQLHNVKKWKKVGAIALVHWDAERAAHLIWTTAVRRMITWQKRDTLTMLKTFYGESGLPYSLK